MYNYFYLYLNTINLKYIKYVNGDIIFCDIIHIIIQKQDKLFTFEVARIFHLYCPNSDPHSMKRGPRKNHYCACVIFVLNFFRGQRMRSPRWRIGSHSPVSKALSKLLHIKNISEIFFQFFN